MKKLIMASVLALASEVVGMHLTDQWYEVYMSNDDRMIMRYEDFNFKYCKIAIPVDGVKEGESVTPVFYAGGVTSFGGYKIYTDEWMFDYFLGALKGGKAEWSDDYVDDCHEFAYDTASCEYEIDSRVWFGGVKNQVFVPNFEEIKPNPERRWIVASLKPASYYGKKNFKVGLKETGKILEYSPEVCYETPQSGVRISDLTNRIKFSKFETDDFTLFWDEGEFFEMEPVDYEDPVTIEVLEAGRIVFMGLVNPDEIALQDADGKEYPLNDDGTNAWIEVQGKTKLKVYDSCDWCADICAQSILFYPKSAPVLAITATQFDHDADGVYRLNGCVKGLGTFKVGETVKITASSKNSVFVGWQVAPGPLSGVDLTKPTLSFSVTPEMIAANGDAPVVVSAIWDPYKTVFALPSQVRAGTVAGSGNYRRGTVVSLRATAAKGFVFAGWHVNADCTQPLDGPVDFRTAHFPYTVPETNTTLYAKFVSATADQNIALYANGNEVTSNTMFNTSGELSLALKADSASLPKIAVSGLPAGLKFTAKEVLNKDRTVLAEANTIYGKATKPGTYVVTVKLTNTTVKKAIEKKFTIVVDNLTDANEAFYPAPQNAPGEKYELSAGVMDLSMLPSLALKDPEAKLSVSGLPAGLKYNTKTGKIEGVATKPGTYTVYLTVKEGKVKKVSTVTIVVTALPNWAVGTFDGFMVDSKDGYFGLSITISTAGKISAKVFGGKSTQTVKGTLTRKEDNQYVAELDLTGKDWSDQIVINVFERDSTGCGRITGTLTEETGTESMSATIEANQNTWSSKTLVLPTLKTGMYWLDGGGLVFALKIGAKGKVTVGAYDSYWAKKPRASGSAQIAVWPDGNGWQGCIPVLIVMDKSKGEGVADWIDVSIKQDGDGTMSFSLPEHDPLPLNWFVGTYTGRMRDHVVLSGYFDETIEATISIAVKQSGDATATIKWDDGSRDTYTLKCSEGLLDPNTCKLKASYTDKLQGARLYYDVTMTITRASNGSSNPTATFSATSSGYLYVRTIYGYDTISYSDTLKNESELRKK